MRSLRLLTVTAALLALAAPAALAADFTPRVGEITPTPSDYTSVGDCITQSTDLTTITALNSVSCNAGGLHTDNSYFRRFDLDGDHGIVTAYNVSSVMIGVELAEGAGGVQPITVNLYTIASGASFLLANLTPIGSNSTSIADQALSTEVFAVAGAVADPVANDLVVEIFTPNGQSDGNSFFIGSNASAETAPSYILAADCGIAEPATTAAIGFPDMHIVMEVCGATDPPTSTENATWGSVKALYR